VSKWEREMEKGRHSWPGHSKNLANIVSDVPDLPREKTRNHIEKGLNALTERGVANFLKEN